MKDIKAIILLVISAILFAVDIAFKSEINKAIFWIILIIGWILLFTSIGLQIKQKRVADGRNE